MERVKYLAGTVLGIGLFLTPILGPLVPVMLDRTVTPTAISDQRWYEDGSYGTRNDGGCWPGLPCDEGRK